MPFDYSIIIPAYNEEALLENTIKQLHKSMAGHVGIDTNGQTKSVKQKLTDHYSAIIQCNKAARCIKMNHCTTAPR